MDIQILVDSHVNDNGSGYVNATIFATASRPWRANAVNGQEMATYAAKAMVKHFVFGEVMEALTELKRSADSEEEWLRVDRVLHLIINA